MNKDFIRFFKLGFLSIFKISTSNIKKPFENNNSDILREISEDINIAFEKLKNKYERN